MTERNTSAVFTGWRVLPRILQAASFPQTQASPAGVAVFFGDPDNPPVDVPVSFERVAVIPAIDTPDEDWGQIGNGARDERFRLIVQVASLIPGQTELQAAARLEQLTSTVERAIRSTMLGSAEERPDEFASYPVWIWAPVSTLPLLALTPEGTVGRAEITVDCQVRINTLPPA